MINSTISDARLLDLFLAGSPPSFPQKPSGMTAVPFDGFEEFLNDDSDNGSVSIASSSVVSIDLGDEIDAELLLSSRKENWYKYAGYGVIGMIGIAILITGLVLGYTWVALGAGGIALLASGYNLKVVDDQVKKEYKEESIPKRISLDYLNEEEKDIDEPFIQKRMPKNESIFRDPSGKPLKYHPLIG